MNAAQQFNKVFLNYSPKIVMIAKSFSRRSGVPVTEFISQLNEALWVAYQKHDPNQSSLDTWLNTRLRDCAKRVASRKEYDYYSRVTNFEPPDADDDAPTSEIADSFDLENSVVNKREDDQRQLIAYLSDPAQVDTVTNSIVTMFSQYDSITALAKALGIHHETVSRKLRKLSRRYDANRFGEVRDYLAV
ncbi:NUMOD1 domain-containing DNA-binding protein [Paenibacillus jamilae]|uniref:NUMOD1 domain-containing DNA-binding protein n=1 Tax=Paenibacillus jamilae TaxID=114136 RepID=UPI003D2C5824